MLKKRRQRLTKAELIAAIAEATGLSKFQARKAVDAFTATVTEALKKGDEVRLVGFGTFLSVKREEGTTRNPRTGETVRRPAGVTARFRVGSELKNSLGGNIRRAKYRSSYYDMDDGAEASDTHGPGSTDED